MFQIQTFFSWMLGFPTTCFPSSSSFSSVVGCSGSRRQSWMPACTKPDTADKTRAFPKPWALRTHKAHAMSENRKILQHPLQYILSVLVLRDWKATISRKSYQTAAIHCTVLYCFEIHYCYIPDPITPINNSSYLSLQCFPAGSKKTGFQRK